MLLHRCCIMLHNGRMPVLIVARDDAISVCITPANPTLRSTGSQRARGPCERSSSPAQDAPPPHPAAVSRFASRARGKHTEAALVHSYWWCTFARRSIARPGARTACVHRAMCLLPWLIFRIRARSLANLPSPAAHIIMRREIVRGTGRHHGASTDQSEGCRNAIGSDRTTPAPFGTMHTIARCCSAGIKRHLAASSSGGRSSATLKADPRWVGAAV
ncbi:hypothetical protein C2E23DRAFT_184522 [Lenzites betulinus]|nr:hypothetical protein C2E23DRAFT_184522 [Lenzites betulinus]